MFGQGAGNRIGEWHRSGLAPLGPVDLEDPADDLDLLLDPKAVPQEVDVTDAEAERLPWRRPQPAATTATAR